MDEERAGVPRPNVKLDHAITRNSKRGNPVKLWFGAVGKIVWWSYSYEPFLAQHRAEALGDAPMPRHGSEHKLAFLQVHDPQSRRAIQCQFGVFDDGLDARCVRRPDDSPYGANSVGSKF